MSKNENIYISQENIGSHFQTHSIKNFEPVLSGYEDSFDVPYKVTLSWCMHLMNSEFIEEIVVFQELTHGLWNINSNNLYTEAQPQEKISDGFMFGAYF